MSIWNINEKKRNIVKLDKDIDTDILIIGAGLTGMNLSYHLQDKNVVIVDSDLYGHGITQNTTAKITFLQERNYTKIISLRGLEYASLYLKSQIDAINSLKDIIEKEKIDCDFINTPSYLFASTRSELYKLRDEVAFLKNHNVNIKKKKLPEKIKSYESYIVGDTYTFNPIKYLDGLYNIIKDKVPLYEKTKIINIKKGDRYYCYTKNNVIRCKKVVLACHYPFFLFPFFLPLKCSIEKSYMVISRIKTDKNYSLINTSKPIYSCRFYKDGDNYYQISLAESHNISFKQNDKEHFKRVKQIFKLKDKDIIQMYSNVDIISHDYMPYIGMLKKDLYISTGYNTWGMTNSMLGSIIISDLINNKKNIYSSIFNPNRCNAAYFVKIPVHVLSQIKSFFGPKIIKNKNWYSSDIKFFKKNGLSLASYKGHIIINKCPHLGCSLIFNEEEKTWDCPCHSSRFDIDGNCIKGPSKYNINYKNNE